MDLVLVSCSFPDETLALAAAGAVVDEGLAACCQVSAPVTSLYRWEGRTERAAEVILACKTTAGAWPALCDFLKARHPYEVPEIIAWPITHGLPAYLDWVRLNTAAGPPS